MEHLKGGGGKLSQEPAPLPLQKKKVTVQALENVDVSSCFNLC